MRSLRAMRSCPQAKIFNSHFKEEQMIDQNIIHLNFIKKEPQSGSYQGMRYLFARGKNGEEDCIDVTIWPEPLCFVKTPQDQKETKQFPLTVEGKEDAVDWLNEQYEAQKKRWRP